MGIIIAPTAPYAQAELRGDKQKKDGKQLLEQVEVLYSRWSMAERVEREMKQEGIYYI